MLSRIIISFWFFIFQSSPSSCWRTSVQGSVFGLGCSSFTLIPEALGKKYGERRQFDQPTWGNIVILHHFRPISRDRYIHPAAWDGSGPGILKPMYHRYGFVKVCLKTGPCHCILDDDNYAKPLDLGYLRLAMGVVQIQAPWTGHVKKYMQLIQGWTGEQLSLSGLSSCRCLSWDCKPTSLPRTELVILWSKFRRSF